MQIETQHLRAAVKALAPTVPSNTFNECYTHLHIAPLPPDAVWISATDGSTLARYRIPATFDKRSPTTPFLLPANKLGTLLRLLEADTLVFHDGDKLTLQHGKSRMTFAKRTDVAAFSVERRISDITKQPTICLPIPELVEALQTCLPLVSTDATHAKFTGVAFSVSGVAVTLQATNMLAIVKTVIAAKSTNDLPFPIVVITRAALTQLIHCLLASGDDDVDLTILRNQVQWETVRTQFNCGVLALKDGKWASTDEVFATAMAPVLHFDAEFETLSRQLRRAMSSADELTNTVTFTLDNAGCLHMQSAGEGSDTEEILEIPVTIDPLPQTPGLPPLPAQLEVSYNTRTLDLCLSAFRQKQVSVIISRTNSMLSLFGNQVHIILNGVHKV